MELMTKVQNKTQIFACLHCGVLDHEGFTTMIVKILSPFVEQCKVK